MVDDSAAFLRKTGHRRHSADGFFVQRVLLGCARYENAGACKTVITLLNPFLRSLPESTAFRYCPSNISATVFESRGSKSIQIRYVSSPGSYFRLAYSSRKRRLLPFLSNHDSDDGRSRPFSADIDPCLYYNNANCTHGKCWPEEGKATCVCDACYRGIGCSESTLVIHEDLPLLFLTKARFS